MKKSFLISIAVAAVILVSCGTYGNLDVSKVAMGMSKGDVIEEFGPFERVLSATNSTEGYVEVLEYRTGKDEVYALEFLNGYLKGYEFLQRDESAPKTTYIYPTHPYPYYDSWRPIIVVPDKPSKPSGNGLGQTLPAPSRPSSTSNSGGKVR